MAKKPTCPYCNEFVESIEYKKYKNRKYHTHCYKSLMDELYATEQNKEERDVKKELYKYICELHSLEELTPLISQQIKNYISEGMKYGGILLTLKYFYEVLGNSINGKAKGIGIVPYKYQEAKDYHIDKARIHKILKETNLQKTNKNKIVRINIPSTSLGIEEIDISKL